MNTFPPLSRALLALVATGLATNARAFTWGGKMDMAVVAEFGDPAVTPTRPTAGRPAYYVAYDGGYIEAGDPIGGEKPPAAAAVAQAVAAALASQHFLPAGPGTSPSLLLIYHWGLINRDSFQLRSSLQLQPNLRARIALLTTAKYARRIEEDLLDRRQPVDVHIPIIDPTERDLLQLIRDNRYFVVVSAYDYASVARKAAKLAWRLKLSTRAAGVAMDEALPALLRGGAPYLGRNLTDTQYVREPVVPAGRVEVGAPKVEAFLPPPETAPPLSPPYLDGLIDRDHAQFTGKRADSGPTDNDAAPAADPDAGTAFLPPALAARIRAYEQQKAALQAALAAQIGGRAAGPDTSRAIDAFNQANAARIAALTTERETIRDELARLAAANTDAAAGKSLEALQHEFTADAQQLSAGTGGDN
jgi:hypothetical protein